MSLASKQNAAFESIKNMQPKNPMTTFDVELGHSGTGNQSEFPVPYFEEQEKEKKAYDKIRYAPKFAADMKAHDVDNTVQTVVSPTWEMLEVYKQKEEEAALAEYEQWLGQNYLGLYDKYGNPKPNQKIDISKIKLVQELFPDYFERRLAQIDRNIEIQRKAAQIRLFGVPRSKEDLEFLYLQEKGYIEIPSMLPYETGTDKATGDRTRGILNMNRYSKNTNKTKREWQGNELKDTEKGYWSNQIWRQSANSLASNIKYQKQ